MSNEIVGGDRPLIKTSGSLTGRTEPATTAEVRYQKPGREAGFLRLLLKFLSKATEQELSKLPGGSFLTAGTEVAAEMAKDEQDRVNEERIERILIASEATQEQILRLSDFVAAIFFHRAELVREIGERSGIDADQLSQAAKESALLIYRSKIARECRDVDRLGMAASISPNTSPNFRSMIFTSFRT